MKDNHIEIAGRMENAPAYSHEFEGVTFYVVTVKTSYRRRDNIEPAEVRVYLPESLILDSEVLKCRNIKVTGHLINSIHHMHKDLSVVAESVEVTDEDIEPADFAKVTGTVTRMFTNDGNYVNFANFIVSLESEDTKKRGVSVRATAWGKLSKIVYSSLQLGDKVTVMGALGNSKYQSKGISRNGIDQGITISELYCFACKRQQEQKQES